MDDADLRVVVEAARQAARKAVEEARGPVRQYGEVAAVDGDDVAVTLDGSDVDVPCQAVSKIPSVGDRVLVELDGGAGRVVGIVGGWA